MRIKIIGRILMKYVLHVKITMRYEHAYVSVLQFEKIRIRLIGHSRTRQVHHSLSQKCVDVKVK